MAFAKGINRAAKGAFRRWLGVSSSPVALAAPKPVEKRLFSPAAVSDLATFFAAGREVGDTFRAPERPKWVDQWLATARSGANGGQVTLAMDSVPFEDIQDYALLSSPWSEGLGFLGYGYLSELQQRPEYRRISEIWAAECTRKWVKLKGDDPKRIAAIEKLMRDFGVREKFREAIEVDGAQGRSHVFMDFGDDVFDLQDPLEYTPETVPVGALKNLKVVEPFWCYPLQFGTTNPLANDYYRPSQWQVMSSTVHNSRLLTFVGRELPDILKPVYMFGGLSLSQMAKPYIDNFVKNRTSVANLLYSFSTMVLSTNMGAMLDADGAQAMIRRMQAYAYGRDNGGLMMVDKETEDLKNVSAPISGVDKLLAQAQEFISSVVGIPLVVLLGVTPSGLNASSEGELTAFHDHIKGYQEKTLQAPLTALLRVLQLHLDGRVDETLTFEFVNLSEPTELEKSTMRQNNMATATGYINAGVLSPEDERERLMGEEGGLWFGMKLKEPPAPQDYNEEGPDDDGGRANDAGETQHWITVHPDGPDSKGTPMLITSGGKVVGGAGGKLDGHILEHVQSMSGARQRGNKPERPEGHVATPAPVDETKRKEGEGYTEHAHRMSGMAGANPTAANHRAAWAAHLGAMANAQNNQNWDNAGHHEAEARKHESAFRSIEEGPHWATDRASKATAAALAASKGLKSDDLKGLERANMLHKEAYTAHTRAKLEARQRGDHEAGQAHLEAANAHGKTAAGLRKKIEAARTTVAKTARNETAAQALDPAHMAFVQNNAQRYEGAHADAIAKDLKDRFNLDLYHDRGEAELEKLRKDKAFIARYNNKDPEVRAAARKEWQELNDKHALIRPSGHNAVNLDSKSEGAKLTRASLGHLAEALEHLERQGFDIKSALGEAKVGYLAGSPKKENTNGHAVQTVDGRGAFSLHHQRTSPERLKAQMEDHANRMAAGQPRWSVSGSAGPALAARTTVIHELAHALGMQSHIGSPNRLQSILAKLHPDLKTRREWVRNNISEYADESKYETDAELAAMVSGEGYKRGTLPKELEDHVDWLFNPKGTAK